MQTRKLVAAMLGTVPLLGIVGTLIIRTSLAAEHLRGRSASMQDTIQVTRNGSRASQRGPAEYFTGAARIDPLFDPNDVANAGAAYVTFEPGARTAWHTHPRGQRLVVTAGVGRVQRWQGPATSPTTLRGGTWRCSIVTPPTRAGLSGSVGSTAQ